MTKQLCILGCFVCAALALAQGAANDQKAMEGTWLPTAAELNTKALPEEALKTMKLVLAGDQYTVTVGEAIDRGTIKLDVTKNPKAMDIIGNDGPNKGKTFLAIYEQNGDTLRICYDLTGKARPTEFKTQTEGVTFLATYKRGKS